MYTCKKNILGRTLLHVRVIVHHVGTYTAYYDPRMKKCGSPMRKHRSRAESGENDIIHNCWLTCTAQNNGDQGMTQTLHLLQDSLETEFVWKTFVGVCCQGSRRQTRKKRNVLCTRLGTVITVSVGDGYTLAKLYALLKIHSKKEMVTWTYFLSLEMRHNTRSCCSHHLSSTYQTNEQLLMCATEIIMVQIEQQVLLLWHISHDKKYVHVTIPFLLCTHIYTV